jgi:xylulose-5-phosphate/fructose-6-phosphate phosphoketolase
MQLEGRPAMVNILSETDRGLIDAYWRAANYLSVGQIYLFDNPLLKVPLEKNHIKPRLLGHWGTTPGLNFIYAHLNRLIKKRDLDMIYITGPGHGGPPMPISKGPTARSIPTFRRTRRG